MFITSSLPGSRVKEYFCNFFYIFKLHYMMLLWYLKRELLGLYKVKSSCRPKILQSNLFRFYHDTNLILQNKTKCMWKVKKKQLNGTECHDKSP